MTDALFTDAELTASGNFLDVGGITVATMFAAGQDNLVATGIEWFSSDVAPGVAEQIGLAWRVNDDSGKILTAIPATTGALRARNRAFFSVPIPLIKNETYYALRFTDRYPATNGYFATAHASAPDALITAPASIVGATNGRFNGNSATGLLFPIATGQSAAYFVSPIIAVNTSTAPSGGTTTPGAGQPNSEIVARAWLATIPGITAGMVSTNLPRDNATWSASGFVQVSGVVGGGMDMDTGMNNPVISLDLWGATGGSALPPWGKVARLGRLIMDSCVGSVADHVLLNLGTKYAQARVTDAIARTEPRRVPGDKSGYAHYTMDLQLSWVKV